MGMPLLKGRWITDAESTGVVLVNETFARIVFGDGDPIGRSIRLPRQQPDPVAAIVGVVADLKTTRLDADPGPEVYIPYSQSPFVRMHDVVVKIAGNPLAMAPALRELVSTIDRTQPVFRCRPWSTRSPIHLAAPLQPVPPGCVCRERYCWGLWGCMRDGVHGLADFARYRRVALGARQAECFAWW